ncbi:MAG: translation initiation factor IF-1 [Thermoguttaceae bacterium]|nr:translation initiation factor IF-1 [Thermoguttaceae bacterium]
MSNKEEEFIQATGVVKEAVRGAFIVKLDNSEHIVTCRLAGKMRKSFIRVVAGDHVTVAISPYDLDRGRIVYRDK